MVSFHCGISQHKYSRSRYYYIGYTLLLLLAALVLAAPALAWGGKTRLARHYQTGQQWSYQTTMRTTVQVSSHPEGLKALLPPLPTSLGTRQQNTITVRSVTADGVAEVENRFDRFEFESNFAESLPEDLREAAAAAQEEFSRQLNGQTLTARYDGAGRLVSFGGAEAALQQLDRQLQEPARQILRVFLEQMGGGALFPDHPVKKGEEWKLKLDAPPSGEYPFTVEGENTLRFVGQTRHRGVKAAIIDLSFTNLLRPSLDHLRRDGAYLALQAQGMGLDIRLRGEGQGRVLVALDDGRILQNHTTVRQRLTAEMAKAGGNLAAGNGPLTLHVDSETKLEIEGIDPSAR
jgi:hypothetical protein